MAVPDDMAIPPPLTGVPRRTIWMCPGAEPVRSPVMVTVASPDVSGPDWLRLPLRVSLKAAVNAEPSAGATAAAAAAR